MKKNAVYKHFVVPCIVLALLLICSACQSPLTIHKSNLAAAPDDWDINTPPEIPAAAGKKPWIENIISAPETAEIKNSWENGHFPGLADPEDVARTFIESSDDLSFADENEWRIHEDIFLADNPDGSKTAYFYSHYTDNYRRLEINLKQFDFAPIWYVDKYRIMRIINARDMNYNRIRISSDINQVRYRMNDDGPDQIINNPDGTRILSYSAGGGTHYDLEGNFVEEFPTYQLDFYLNKYDVVWRIEEENEIKLVDLIDEYGEPMAKEDDIYWYQCEDLEERLGFEIANGIAVKKIMATYKDMSEAKELPTQPRDCVWTYAYAVINGDGIRQFTLFDDALQEKTRESFEAQGWVTDTNPSIKGYDVTEISDLEYEVVFLPDYQPVKAADPDLQTSGSTIRLTLVQEGEYYKITNYDNSDFKENTWAPEPWQKAYAEFLTNPANYVEDGHYADMYALADIDRSGTPELIIAFFNHIEGGFIFANIYSYNGDVNRIGQRIDLYYKSCWFSSDPTLPGLFVEGGRNSTFACNFWSIKENRFITEPLWTDAYNFDTNKMEYKELSDNTQLINEANRAVPFPPEGTVDFFEINETGIQKIYR